VECCLCDRAGGHFHHRALASRAGAGCAARRRGRGCFRASCRVRSGAGRCSSCASTGFDSSSGAACDRRGARRGERRFAPAKRGPGAPNVACTSALRQAGRACTGHCGCTSAYASVGSRGSAAIASTYGRAIRTHATRVPAYRGATRRKRTGKPPAKPRCRRRAAGCGHGASCSAPAPRVGRQQRFSGPVSRSAQRQRQLRYRGFRRLAPGSRCPRARTRTRGQGQRR